MASVKPFKTPPPGSSTFTNSVYTRGNSWQSTKSEITRNTILDAACNCFKEYGYHNTTTPLIAKMANLSRGAMTHHFKSREDVIYEGVEHLYKKRISEYESLMEKATQKFRGGIDPSKEHLKL